MSGKDKRRLDVGSHSALRVTRALLFSHLLLSPLVFSRSTLEAFEYPKVALLVLAALAAGTAALAAWVAERAPSRPPWGERMRAHVRQPIRLGILLFLLSAAVSTAASISPRTSWQGAHRSDAGLLTVLAYSILFVVTRFACRDASDFRRLLGATALATGPVVAYALLQLAGADPLRWRDVAEFAGMHRPASTMGHANFLAAFLAMAIPLLACFGARAAGSARRGLAAGYALIALGAGTVVVASLSRAGWLALAVTAPFLAYGAARASGRAPRPARVAAPALLAAAVLGGAVFALARNGRLGEPLRHRLEQVSSGPPEPRRYIWRAALAMFRERPLTGVGLDAFQLGFQRHRSLDFWRAEGHVTPQKAHSEPLHVLATQGAFGAAALLVILGGAVRAAGTAWRRPGADADLVLAAMAGLAAFAVQSLFSFTVAGLGTLALTLLALLSRLGEDDAGRVGAAEKAVANRDRRPLVAVAGTAVAVAAWALVIDPFRANVAAARGSAILAADPSAALRHLEEATQLDPGRALYWRQLGTAAEGLARSAPPEARAPRFERARAALARSRDLVPSDAYGHASLGRVLTAMASERPPLATPADANAAFDAALARDPLNPFLYGEAARAAIALDDLARARAWARKGRRLDPEYAPVSWALGYAALAEGMEARGSAPEGARAHFEAAAALLGPSLDLKWLGDERGRGLAASQLSAALVMLDRLNEARSAAERAVAILPDFADARFNLGRIHERLGQREEAKAHYRRILRGSPGYGPAKAALAALEASPSR